MPVTKPSTIVRALLALGAAAVLAACSVLPKGEPVQVWQPPENNAAISATGADFSLRIDTPNATGLLGNNPIVVLPAPGEVNTYKGARWNDAPPLLVRQRLVDAFMAAKLPAVTTDDDHFFADYSLSSDLRAFQSEYRNGAPVIVVRLDVQLRRGGSRRLSATHSFVVTQTPAGVAVPQIVAAFGAADDALAQQVVAWTTATVERDQATPPADSQTTRHR